MSEFPDARRAELEALIGSVDLTPGDLVIDIQAAGGFVADEVHRRLFGEVECVCIEPSATLRRRLNPVHRAVADSVHAWRSIADGSADVALGLASLHHSESASGTIGEAFRALKPGGQFAVCDVIPGSPVARWLNDFVDQHNQTGHAGRFYNAPQLRAMLTAAGFHAVTVRRRTVPWRFMDHHRMIRFLQGLFGLECPLGAIEHGVREYLGVAERQTGLIELNWELNYAVARKPG